MRLVIIESPFRDNPERSLKYLRDIALACVKMGESAWGSHMIWPQILAEDEESRNLGIRAGFAWGHVADVHAFYTDLGWSSGMMNALKLSFTCRWRFEIRALRMSVALPPGFDTWDADYQKLVRAAVRENYHGQTY